MATEVVHVIDPDAGSGYDYDSLFDWEAAEQGDLTGARDEIAVAKCRCTGGTADSTAVTIDGWTTSSTQYIKIWTDPAESYRHNGAYQTGNKYRIERAATDGDLCALENKEPYVKIDGIQVQLNFTNYDESGYNRWGINAANYITDLSYWIEVTNCIVRTVGSPTNVYTTLTVGIGFWHNNISGPPNFYLVNCIIDGFDFNSTSYGLCISRRSANGYYYNNTINNCYIGIYRYVGTANVKNTIINNCDVASSGLVTSDCDYNSTSSSSIGYTENTHDRVSQTFSFTDAANCNFHLLSSDTGALGYGVNLYNDATYPFQDDIDGNDRGGSGASWDIGADEYVSSGSSAVPIFGSEISSKVLFGGIVR